MFCGIFIRQDIFLPELKISFVFNYNTQTKANEPTKILNSSQMTMNFLCKLNIFFLFPMQLLYILLFGHNILLKTIVTESIHVQCVNCLRLRIPHQSKGNRRFENEIDSIIDSVMCRNRNMNFVSLSMRRLAVESDVF